MVDFFIAFMLLIADPDPEIDYNKYATPHITYNVKAIAYAWELMDHKEDDYFFIYEEKFTEDLFILQTRRKDLVGAPAARDLALLPDLDMIYSGIQFNRAYKEEIEHQRYFRAYKDFWYECTLSETEELYFIWKLAEQAKADYYSIATRRKALAELRDLIGKSNFYGRNFPPFVPLWRFHYVQ